MRIKSIYTIISILLLLGCKEQQIPLDNNVMQYYLDNTLSYPSTGEEYCLNTYRVDSLNGFPLLKMWKELGNNIDTMNIVYEYEDYNYTLDSLFSVYKDMMDKDVNDFRVAREIDWQYIYQNKDDIVFQQHNDKLQLINTNEKKTFESYNILSLQKQFLNDVGSIEYDIKLIGLLKDFLDVKLYTKDSLCISLSLEDEYSEENLRNNISNIIKRCEIEKTNSHGLLLHYNREGEMIDYNKQDSVPSSIKQNIELRQYLNSIFEKYPQAHFIHFVVWQK